jgi:hypothetical protein
MKHSVLVSFSSVPAEVLSLSTSYEAFMETFLVYLMSLVHDRA